MSYSCADTYNPVYHQRYTPVLIQYVRTVLKAEESEQNRDARPNPENRILIEPPLNNNWSYEQPFPGETQMIQVPNDGIVRLKLLPTTGYIPNGSYKVKYFISGSTHPTAEEEWFVPYISHSCQLTINHNASLRGDPIPEDKTHSFAVFDIKSISPQLGEYRLYQNTIQWLSDGPQDGQTYTVTYVPALTRKHLIRETKRQKGRGWVY